VTGGKSSPGVGRAFEYKTRDMLASAGYWVMRSPASRSPVDMVAIKPGQVLFVQCKVNGELGPAEWNALWEAAYRAGGKAVLVSRPGRGHLCLSELTGPKLAARSWPQPMRPFIVDELDEEA
jgi:Holliday junction resolvase